LEPGNLQVDLLQRCACTGSDGVAMMAGRLVSIAAVDNEARWIMHTSEEGRVNEQAVDCHSDPLSSSSLALIQTSAFATTHR